MIAWKIGGDQGEGIDSTGDVLATVLNRLGYYVYGYKSFSSRIKGGHTNYKVRISSKPVSAPTPETQMLIALTQETIDKNIREVAKGGVVLADSQFKPTWPEGVKDIHCCELPITQMARAAGDVIMRNMVTAGASAFLMDIPLAAFEDYVSKKFSRKGQEVVDNNIAALRAGYEGFKEAYPDVPHFALPPGDGKARFVMNGNQAMALAAYAAGCRFMAAYPITPASDVLEHLLPLMPRKGGVVVQMEDELASITSVIGAGFAGVRAMTCTSGPGLSLMQEAIGLASMTETPVVIIDCQRGGPSTGMPTKNEQSDILAMIFGGHGEGPRIVLAPGTLEEAFNDVVSAFNLAERFQCPVIVASDLSLSLWPQTTEGLPFKDVTIDRGPRISSEELLKLGKAAFERYALTESGVSARAIPGQPNGQFLATGAEHNAEGKVSEDPKNRMEMMRKRLTKVARGFDQPGVVYDGPAEAEVVLVGFGSTSGALKEAQETLRTEGVSVGLARVRVLDPFPTQELSAIIDRARDVVVVEQNATGQLLQLMRAKGVLNPNVRSVLKYDGQLIYPGEIVRGVLEGASLQEVLR